ncbi:MAG: MFS transporter [Caldilineaceae bacterium]|nr:MFS transporter [Caldilineaceae bacterium]
MLARRLQRPGFFYGWVIVLVSFLIIAFVFGVRLSFGIFFDALTRDSDFGWSRADTAGVFSVTMLVFAATSTSIGWLLDRWGPRRVYSAGILIMASGLWLTSRMTSLLDFYLFYGVWTGLGITVLGLSMHAATIARWFDRLGRRGLAIGLAFSGSGIGILVLAPIIERTISAAGWRAAYVMLAVLLSVTTLPLIALLLRNRPEELGLQPDGVTRRGTVRQPAPAPGAPAARQPAAGPEPVWTFAKALTTPIFWLLMVSGTLSLFTLRMVTVHQTAHLVDQGIPRLTAATILGSTGLVTAGAFIVFGSLSDRIGRARSFYIGSGAQCAALLVLMALPQTPPLWLLYLYVILWGVGEGSRSGLLTAIAGDTFPGPSVGVIVGTMGGFFGLGAAIGSWLAGYIYDVGGSYTPAFALALAGTVVATMAIAAAMRLQRR